jgi:hypothetical protein
MGVLGRRKGRRAFWAAPFISADASLKFACSGVPNRMACLIFLLRFRDRRFAAALATVTAPNRDIVCASELAVTSAGSLSLAEDRKTVTMPIEMEGAKSPLA